MIIYAVLRHWGDENCASIELVTDSKKKAQTKCCELINSDKSSYFKLHMVPEEKIELDEQGIASRVNYRQRLQRRYQRMI